MPVGLLVAACVNRAPQGTFGAAVAEVGVLDLLKVMTIIRIIILLFNLSITKFHQFTIGGNTKFFFDVFEMRLIFQFSIVHRKSMDERLWRPFGSP